MANISLNFFDKFNKTKIPRSRVELHLHLDGSFRISTILELAKGDDEAIERAAYELCEDQANEGVIYFEARFSPQLMANTHTGPQLSTEDPLAFTPKMVTESVLKGLKQGEKDFNIKARVILCCLRFTPDWNAEVLQLCQEFKEKGVVGIDIAGDEADDPNHPKEIFEKNNKIFQEAKRLGIHRTVHAAEAGTADHIRVALYSMGAERVGHGYRVVENEEIYKNLLDSKAHIECCPISSIMTGSVSLDLKTHPIIRFVEDNANFSISKDDPLITGASLDDEYQFLTGMGLTEAHITRANFNAARSCFLPDEEKAQLLNQLNKIYGVTV